METINIANKYDDLYVKSNEVNKSYSLKSSTKYTGQFSGHRKQGRGTLKWIDGSRYDGYWSNDKANGHGRLIIISKAKTFKFYMITWDLLNFQLCNRECILKQLSDIILMIVLGSPNSNQNYQYSIYEGEFVNNLANGIGSYHNSDGSVYRGEWKNNKPHGEGEEIWPNESKFKGTFVNGKKEGYGSYLLSDGSQYKGSFEKNRFWGFGKMAWSDGRKYKGRWKLSLMDGEGIFTWKNGIFISLLLNISLILINYDIWNHN